MILKRSPARHSNADASACVSPFTNTFVSCVKLRRTLLSACFAFPTPGGRCSHIGRKHSITLACGNIDDGTAGFVER